jgi:ABC-2 type transport system ATP-binding protein
MRTTAGPVRGCRAGAMIGGAVVHAPGGCPQILNWLTPSRDCPAKTIYRPGPRIGDLWPYISVGLPESWTAGDWGEGDHVASAASPLSDGLSSERTDRAPKGEGEPSPEPVIQVHGLRMSYGGTEAVAGIDLEVYRGEVFAFLGPNGAGKTTTVEILEGYRHRTAGEVSVLGLDPISADGDWRARIGVVLQESAPDAELTVKECVSRYAGYYPKPRSVAETLELVGLADRPNVRCRRLSGGQRRRLDVALALIGDPELVFLDEPTTGFDPAARRSAWDVIAGLRDLGKTIFLTTHYMEEAEYLADRIVVIAAGHIVAEGTAATLGGRNVKASIVSFTLPSGVSATDLPAAVTACLTGRPGDKVEASTTSPLPLLGDMAAWAKARKVDLPDLQVIRPTLEEIYLQLTKESR